MADSDDISTEPTLTATAGSPPAEQVETLAAEDGLLEAGSAFGEYTIEGVLGRGGMGVVYRARHRTLDRLVALKVLRFGGGGQDPRFLREARNTARLDHHNIVTVYNAGLEQGQLFIEMELVDGRPLSALLRAGPLDTLRATRFIEQVAHALHHAHGRDVIHRDIKPDNLLVTPDEVVKVTDFGLAKQPKADTMLTAPGSILGTPTYMAPEQWRGDPADARTDLYTVGATYFHLVTGHPPFKGKLPELMAQHVSAPAPLAHDLNPDLPPAVSALIGRLMAKEPVDRPQSAAEVISELRTLQQAPEQEVGADGDSPAPVHRVTETREGSATRPTAQTKPPERALRRTGWLLAGVVWLIVTTLLVTLDRLGTWDRLEMAAHDRQMVGRPLTPASDRVVLVMVDDQTIDKLGMPFKRDRLVDVIEALGRAGAKAVALDLLIEDEGPGNGDPNLAAITASTPALIHAMDLYRASGTGSASNAPPARFAIQGAPTGSLNQATRATVPIPSVLGKAAQLGHVGLQIDPDGLIRSVPLLVSMAGKAYPALSLATACRLLGATVRDVRWSPGEPLTISPPGKQPVVVPVGGAASMRISVRGILGDRRRVSFLKVLSLAQSDTPEADRKLGQLFKGKAVLVGLFASGQQDVQPMPGMLAPPLVIAHAMAVETLLGQDFVERGGWPWLLALVSILGLGAMTGGLRLPWYASLMVVVGAIGGYWLGASALFRASGLALPVMAPCLAMVIGGVAGWGTRLRAEQHQRRLLADALGRYLPRRVPDAILADAKALRLGGQRKELSLVVVRLQGFGALSERLEPEEVGELLSSLFATVAECVTGHDGTLDRFSGEGVRAFFGDPVPCTDHAEHAVGCALEIRAAAQALLARWARGGRPRPPLGVGVHTGYVTVGNIGSVQRMEYTVLGRSVEIAEELSVAARPGTVLASARTRAVALERFIFEERGALAGDGATAPVESFEVCAPR